MKKEIRVYVINVDSADKHYSEYTDEEFMTLSEEQDGNDSGEGVYTIPVYEASINEDLINISETYTRFIEVEVNE